MKNIIFLDILLQNYFKVLIDNLPLSIKESLIFYENKRFPIINKTLLDNLIFLSNSKPSYFFVKNKNRYSKYNKINRLIIKFGIADQHFIRLNIKHKHV